MMHSQRRRAPQRGGTGLALALLTLLLSLAPECAGAFAPPVGGGVHGRFFGGGGRSAVISTSTTELGAAPQPSRQKPRRLLKKRRSRQNEKNRRRDGLAYGEKAEREWQSQFQGGSELRPLVRSRSVEAGEDYWIDESDLRRSQEREQELAARNSRKETREGRIPKSKLWAETLAPYRQNWIGYFSVFIVVMAMMVTQFPELLQTPVIPFPDL